MRGRRIDLTGGRFGRWLVVAIHPARKRYGRKTVHVLWLCRCDCGEQHLVTTSGLRSGHTAQCGRCRREQLREQQRKSRTKHGHARKGKVTRAYTCWANMRQRCGNPRHPRYHDYGGRGIDYCEPWHGFEHWFADNGDPPDGLSFHRIDNDDCYRPGNTEWAPPSVQRANQRPRKKRRAKLEDIKAYADALARARSAPGGMGSAP